ncbi:hypothetical protein [Clostridium muellerianum]|uniref:hypothetical protein n=1 Tax=Clostridium muellerianum TaxID=2716538 RepID=UPI003CCA2CBE
MDYITKPFSPREAPSNLLLHHQLTKVSFYLSYNIFIITIFKEEKDRFGILSNTVMLYENWGYFKIASVGLAVMR